MFSQGTCLGGFGQMGHYTIGGTPIMFIGLILIVGILVYLFSRRNQNNGNQAFQSQSDDALEILKKRFANSEISEKEYLSSKKVLSS